MLALLCGFLAWGCCAADSKNQTNLTIVGEEYAPFSYYAENEVTGQSVDLIEKITADAGIAFNRTDISLLPWDEAYNATVNGSNTLLLGAYRTPSREYALQWVGPIAKDSSALFVSQDLKDTITNVSDLKKYRIGVKTGDAHYDMLTEYGVPVNNIITDENVSELREKVQEGSLDGFFYGEQAGKYIIAQDTGSEETLPIALIVDEQDVWFGLSPDTPAEVVRSLQDSLEKRNVIPVKNITE